MNKAEIATLLPTEPRKGMREWAKQTCNHYLGREMILFSRESIAVELELKRTMTPEDREEHLWRTKRRWGARCVCTRCNEEFVGGWVSYPKADVKGIRLYMGEDAIYPGYVEPNDPMAIEIGEGDSIICPWCEQEAVVVPTANVRGGITYQSMVVSVEVVDRYTAVIGWLYRRRIDESGYWSEDLRPAKAAVIDTNGSLKCFTHISHGIGPATSDLEAWKPIGRCEDPLLTIYYNYDAINHRCVGGETWNNVPLLADTTGEKTGLAEYVKAGGRFTVGYLKLWKKYPHIENLIKTMWSGHIAKDIDGKINEHLDYGHRSDLVDIDWADLTQAKPSKQLGMTKTELAELAVGWTVAHLKEWDLYRYYSARCTAAEFDGFIRDVGIDAVRELNTYGHDNGDEDAVTEGVQYLRRQKIKASTAADLLIDLWNMLDETAVQGRSVTKEMRFPPSLQQAHDREAVNRKARISAKTDADFTRVLEKYRALEWSDGELCVRLPRSNEDLVREGDTLRHCVGGYGEGHIKEQTVVFFIRKARRPERSYYTMDYNFTVSDLRRHQLHGYGNERHGKNKEYEHKIPKKVLLFAKRWEKEVLKPWWRKEQQKKKRQTDTDKKEKRSA